MKTALTFLVILLGGLFWFFKSDGFQKPEILDLKLERRSDQTANSQVTILANAPFAKKFGNEDLSIHEELDLLQLAFQDYLSFVKKRYRRPIGDNRDFVEVMTGNNHYRIAPIPPQHPRINNRGELTDRLGNPYAIHPLAEDIIEVRAVGTDGLLWTEDDVINLTLAGRELEKKRKNR